MRRIRIGIETRYDICTAKEVPRYWNGRPIGTKLIPCPYSYMKVYGYGDVLLFDIERDCEKAKLNGKEMDNDKIE